MKSKRLNKSHKEEIENLIMYQLFTKKDQNLKCEEKKFGDLCYFSRYTKEEYNNMIHFPNSDKVFKWSSHIYCYLNKNYVHFYMSKSRPHWHTLSDEQVYFSEEHILIKKWDLLCKRKQQVDEEKKEVIQELHKVLGGVTTTKQLLKIWPESLDYLEKIGIFRDEHKDLIVYPTKLNALIERYKNGY